jgi:hypothetical protein
MNQPTRNVVWYELWDVDSANCICTYETLDEAMRDVEQIKETAGTGWMLIEEKGDTNRSRVLENW